ncbi:amidohydrolase family protein [Oceanobacillus halotolerans]|uniref:amidohydrolase family protein n=1 Tax=Oceanobacillus halotolerans TaxID=2663380 RepID=UPI0013D9C4CF|nr:amidohydrolase family protein [Oceanobacillus halotolerans]
MKQAIINSNMFDVKTGTIKDNMTILWEGNTIKEVGENINLSSDVNIIDGAGSFITPGLINGATLLGLKEYGVRWEGDDTFEASGTEQPSLSVIDGIYPFDKGFSKARSAGITTVHVLPGPENVISGITSVIKTTGSVIDEMVVNAQHGLSISLGEVPKQAFSKKFKQPLTRMRIASIIRDRLRKVLYKEKLEGIEDRIVSDILEKKAPMYIRAHRLDDILTAVRLKEEFDINVTLVHATEAHLATDTLIKAEIPVLVGPYYASRLREEIESLHPSHASILKEAGLSFALTTHTIRNLPLEGSLSVREGLSSSDALYALTLGPAKILGISESLGSIEPGKQADIVIWNGEPLELKSNVTQTIISGETVYKREDQSK